MTEPQEITVTVINTTTGEYEAVLNGSSSMVDAQMQSGLIFQPGTFDGARQYPDLTNPENPVAMDKTPVPHTVNGNIITLPGDELHCIVTGPIKDSFAIQAGETELTFTADVPGQYTLTLSGVKYLPTEVDIAI